MSSRSMDQHHPHHKEGIVVGVTVKEQEGERELNGHSSRSSSLSLEEVVDEEECVQNVAQAGDTTLDTLTSDDSSVVCGPEQDHQDVVVIHSTTTSNKRREEGESIADNNQSTIQSRVSNLTNNSRLFLLSLSSNFVTIKGENLFHLFYGFVK